jgi:hypothetical protein
MATNFSGGGSRSTWREPPTLDKQLVNFITCGCESSAPFFVTYDYGVQHHFQKHFSYIVAVSFIVGGNHSPQRKPQTCRKSKNISKKLNQLTYER